MRYALIVLRIGKVERGAGESDVDSIRVPNNRAPHEVAGIHMMGGNNCWSPREEQMVSRGGRLEVRF